MILRADQTADALPKIFERDRYIITSARRKFGIGETDESEERREM